MQAALLFLLAISQTVLATVTPWTCAGGRAAFINELAYGSNVNVGRAVEVITTSNKTNFDAQVIQVSEGCRMVREREFILLHITNPPPPPLPPSSRYLQSHQMALSRHRRLSLHASITLLQKHQQSRYGCAMLNIHHLILVH